MEKISKGFILLFIILSLSGCNKNEEINVNEEKETIEVSSISDEIKDYNEMIVDKEYIIFNDEFIENIINENISLDEDEEIESYEWIQKEKVFRVQIKYIEQPENEYSHKEDYFFFFEDGEIVHTLFVDYPSKSDDVYEDRYVWDACDFAAHLEDVNFDGNDDLIIFLGHAGSHGTENSCAYIYTEEGYIYNPTFEDIPAYEIDKENQVIRGYNVDNAVEKSEYVYVYENNEFVEKEHVTYIYHEDGTREQKIYLSQLNLDEDITNQIKVFAANIPLIYSEYKYDPNLTTITIYDLDKDGKLELITSCIQGTGYFTYNCFYNVNDTFDGISQLEEKVCFSNEISGFDLDKLGLDSRAYEYSGRIYYSADDYTQNGIDGYSNIDGAFYLEDGIIYDVAYRKEEGSFVTESEEYEYVYYDLENGDIVSLEKYEELEKEFFKDMNPIYYRLKWCNVSLVDLIDMPEQEIFNALAECYCN